MHPASRIVLYLIAALVIPGLSFLMLGLFLCLPLLAMALRGRHPARVLWRTRWLLLALALGYAWSVPGDALMPALGEASPSTQGLLRGLAQALHLAVLLVWLDWLVLRLTDSALLAGLAALSAPLRLLRIDARPAVFRLALTLHAVKSLAHAPARQALALLSRDAARLHAWADSLPAHLTLSPPRPRVRDFVVPCAAAAAGLMLHLGDAAWSLF